MQELEQLRTQIYDIDNDLFKLCKGGNNLYKGYGVAAVRPKYQRNYGDLMELDTI